MKTLYLVRHGIAADAADVGGSDARRPLTDEGADRFRAQVRGFSTLDDALDVVLTSPLVRCRQTADLLAAGIGARHGVAVLDALAPGGAIEDVLRGLAGWRHLTSVALVGHEPSIGRLTLALIGATGSMPFKRGMICRVDVESFPPRSAGTLVWALPPRVLRRLAP